MRGVLRPAVPGTAKHWTPRWLLLRAPILIGMLSTTLLGCTSNQSYGDPLAQISRGMPDAPVQAAADFQQTRLGVIYTSNTEKALRAADEVHSSVAMERYRSQAAVEDADPANLTRAIDGALKSHFADVVPLARFEDAQAAHVDAVMFLDMEVTYGSNTGTDTRVGVRGLLTNLHHQKLGEVDARGTATIPSFPTAFLFKPAADRAIQRFSASLDDASARAGRAAAPVMMASLQPTTMTDAQPEPMVQTRPLRLTQPVEMQGRRVALVIGNSSYRNVPQLGNTATDARLIASTLQKLGFEVVGGGALLDLDHDAFVRAVTAFGRQLSGSSVSLFYYAGHGLQMHGENYLVPTDANPQKPSDADLQLIDASLVLHQMEDSGAKLKVVVLDACRNNPFGGQSLRGADGGLAQMAAPAGTLISYATAPGNVAQDGSAGGDSPYTIALAQEMQRPGLDVLRMFNEVAVSVDNATDHAQQPWLALSPISGEFYFAGR